MVIYSALAFKSNVGIYHSEQIAGELTFNFSSLPQLPYLLRGLLDHDESNSAFSVCVVGIDIHSIQFTSSFFRLAQKLC